MTNKAPSTKLRLQRSTIRSLTLDALKQVAGGEDGRRETIDDPFIRRTK